MGAFAVSAKMPFEFGMSVSLLRTEEAPIQTRPRIGENATASEHHFRIGSGHL